MEDERAMMIAKSNLADVRGRIVRWAEHPSLTTKSRLRDALLTARGAIWLATAATDQQFDRWSELYLLTQHFNTPGQDRDWRRKAARLAWDVSPMTGGWLGEAVGE